MIKKTQRAVVCCTPMPEDWTWFVEKLTAPDVRWFYFSSQTKRPWQKRLSRLNSSNPAAAWRAVWAAKRNGASVIVSMSPEIAFWVATWGKLFSLEFRHMTFWFNYPVLPKRWKAWIHSRAFRYIDTIRLQSRIEIELYARYFSLRPDQMTFRFWTMETPEFEPAEPLIQGDYLSAIGGNARDYQTLLAACKLAPEIPMVWVVRPDNVAGMDIPPNVHVFKQIPYKQAMNYLYHSRATVIPLKGSETPCGHVTIVSAMFLRKAILITDSIGIADYIIDGVNGMLCRPNDAEDLARCMKALMSDKALADRLAEGGLRFAEVNCTDSHVQEEMRAYLALSGLTEPISSV